MSKLLPVCNWLGALLLAILVPTASAKEPFTGRFSVPLHRQRVPVIGDKDMVSHKSVYFGKVSVGYPSSQEFTVVFDTGSAYLVLPSVDCASDTCRIHRQYDRQASPHAIDIDYDGSRVLPGEPRDQVTVEYGTGRITGVFVQDRLCLRTEAAPEDSSREGAIEADGAFPQSSPQGAPMQTKTQLRKTVVGTTDPRCVDMRIITATEMSDEPFLSHSFDGILGLSLHSMAVTPEFNVFDILSSRGHLAQSSFAVFLAEGDEEGSEISFGGPNPDRMHGELTWVPVLNPELGHWRVPISALRLGNETLDFCRDGLCSAVVDTGTSLLVGPAAFTEDLSLMLEENLGDPIQAGEEGADCRQATGLPLHLDTPGFTITLEPRDYTRRARRRDSDGPLSPAQLPAEPGDASRSPPRSCWPALMPVDFPEPLGPKLFVFGEPVLRKYYTVYDSHLKRVGFSLAAHAGSAEAVAAGALGGAAAATARGVASDSSAPKRLRQPLFS